MKFDLEVGSIRKSFDERLNKIETLDPAKVEENAKAAIGVLVENWKPEFYTLKDGFSKLKLDATMKDNVVESFEIEISPEDQKKYLEEAAVYIMHNKAARTPENSQKVKEYMEYRYFFDHRKEIVSTILNKAIEKRDAEWAKRTNQPAPLKPAGTPPGKTVSTQEEFVAALTKKR
jgi:hypothetical protein